MSDTPRTDVNLVRVHDRTYVIAATVNCGHDTFVPSHIARDLERELADRERRIEAVREMMCDANWMPSYVRHHLLAILDAPSAPAREDGLADNDRAKIAAALAKALGLEHGQKSYWARHGSPHELRDDGSNVFDDPWFRLALDWLLSRTGASMDLWEDGAHSYYADTDDGGQFVFRFTCPAAEFPARCIAKLVEDGKC